MLSNETKRATIDPYSLVPLYIELQFQGHTLGIATAFIYFYQKKFYLISNWHVLSGRNRFTGKPTDKNAAIPDTIRSFLHYSSGIKNFGWRECYLDILNDDGSPKWFEHPKFGRSVDVAALPIEFASDHIPIPINERPSTAEMIVEIGQNVFVLGYPFGLRANLALPVWKRASIASEPLYDMEKLPLIYVDTATYEGMSGSPVIAKEVHHYRHCDGDLHTDHSADTHYMFVGVYSGRKVTPQGDGSQIGEVWKASVINEIINAKKIADTSIT